MPRGTRAAKPLPITPRPTRTPRASQLVQTLSVHPLLAPVPSHAPRPARTPPAMAPGPVHERTPLLPPAPEGCATLSTLPKHHAAPARASLRGHITCATSPSGHGHPVHHHLQCPSLVLRLQHCLEHGVAHVAEAAGRMFRSLRRAAHLDADDWGVKAPPMSTYSVVVTVFIIAVLTMLIMTAIAPTLLLYMNHARFTSATNITPYVVASAVASAVPIVSNVVLGAVAARIGPGKAMALAALTAAVGLGVILTAKGSLWLFFVGYALYSGCNSIRTVRVMLLSEVVPPAELTTVLATHALMTPVGALMGPLIWIGLQTYRGSFEVLGGSLAVNRFTLDYGIAAFVLLIIAVVSVFWLGGAGAVASAAASSGGASISQEAVGVGEEEPVYQVDADGTEHSYDLHAYRQRVFRFFCAIMFGVNMSAGLFMTSFQPVLVNVFQVSDSKLGVIFETVALFAVLPPLLVAILSRYLMDRHIIIIGLVSKLIGMALFLPMFGPSVYEWQVIIGFVLIIKASIFFSTASMSLFTKLLGRMSSSALIGFLASASSLGPAIAQIALSDHIVLLFDSYSFGLFALPAVISLFFVLLPVNWRRMDPASDETRLLTERAEVLALERREAAEAAASADKV